MAVGQNITLSLPKGVNVREHRFPTFEVRCLALAPTRLRPREPGTTAAEAGAWLAYGKAAAGNRC